MSPFPCIRRRALWRLLLPALLAALPAVAQRADLPARIALKSLPGATEILLTGRRDHLLYARLADSAGTTITYDVADLKRLALRLPPDPIRQAEAAAAAGNTAEAVRLMRGAVQPAVPYLDLPVDGVVPEAFRYAGWLRKEKAWAAAMSVYRALQGNPEPATREQAAAWLAYCHARSLQFQEARDVLAAFAVEDPRHEGFVPGTLALALVKAAEGDDAGSLDLAARAGALARIDHELYAESLFLAASAYARLAAGAALEENRSGVVLRKAGEEVPPPAPMTAAEFTGVASNLFSRIAVLFPSSPFAAEATKQLQEISSATNNPSPASAAPGAAP